MLQSPDGKYNFVFEQKNNKLTYHLDYVSKPVVEEGELGAAYDMPWLPMGSRGFGVQYWHVFLKDS